MINLRFLPRPTLFVLTVITALAGQATNSTPVWAQLRLTKDVTKPSKESSAPAATSQDLRSVDFIVVIVNAEPITRNEIAAKQARLMAQWAAQGTRPPANEAEVYKRVLDRAIEERAVLQAARESGLRVSDDQVNDALMSIARQNQLSSVVLLQNKYEAEGGNWRSYVNEIRSELLLLQAKEREVDAKVRVSEAEIDEGLRAKNQNGTKLQEINLAQILIGLPDQATPQLVMAAQQKAAQIVLKARAGEDFAKLAAQNSDSADKATGGVMGLRGSERYPELFVNATQGLAIGSISEPVQSGAGIHVLKLIARNESSLATWTQSRVRHILLPISADLTEAQAKNRARAFKNQIELQQSNFSALAKDHSADGSGAQGGDLGWAAPGVFVPEFEAAMNRLAIGQVSEPVVTQFGVHLIEVTDRKEVAIPEREQREQIRNQLRARKAAEAYSLWLTETRNRAYVEYRNVAN